jgi:hypothetical protein
MPHQECENSLDARERESSTVLRCLDDALPGSAQDTPLRMSSADPGIEPRNFHPHMGDGCVNHYTSRLTKYIRKVGGFRKLGGLRNRSAVC